MQTEVICSLISLIGIIISAITSRAVARKEFEKLKWQLAHEDENTLKDEVAHAVGCAAEFSRSGRPAIRREAIKQLAAVMVKTNNDLIKELYDCVLNDRLDEASQITKKIAEQGIYCSQAPVEK